MQNDETVACQRLGIIHSSQLQNGHVGGVSGSARRTLFKDVFCVADVGDQNT